MYHFFSDKETVGLILLLVGLGFVYASMSIIIIYEQTKAEKQQVVIDAQKELEKFLIDHPELKEMKEND